MKNISGEHNKTYDYIWDDGDAGKAIFTIQLYRNIGTAFVGQKLVKVTLL